MIDLEDLWFTFTYSDEETKDATNNHKVEAFQITRIINANLNITIRYNQYNCVKQTTFSRYAFQGVLTVDPFDFKLQPQKTLVEHS